MRKAIARILGLCLLSALLLSLCACASEPAPGQENAAGAEPDKARYLVSIEDEPDTVDFQCTTIYYTVAQNVFDRLVEVEGDAEGGAEILPSLAESWGLSRDRCSYTFRLRENVCFSNGSPLTSEDVVYTFTRLLTHPDSCNRDIAEMIVGAAALERGEADELKGIKVHGPLAFTITLEEPFEAFLACLSMPGASILDAETTEAAGDRFGKEPDWTVGTGPFILEDWTPGEGMRLRANPECWSGAPRCAGLDLRFMTDAEEEIALFHSGELDILDLDELGDTAEYFIHGDIYQNMLHKVQPVGITYIALNESIKPLDDLRVRQALQLALDRPVLLQAVYAGRGSVENGIFSRGLYGYNPALPEIPCDPERAGELLAEAGYPEGFDLTVSVKASATQWEMALMRQAAGMWKKLGIRAELQVLEEDEFMRLRKSGKLGGYAATWTADYNDPDNYLYTFFGSRENTSFRSLCYPREEIMARVRAARRIADPDARLREYRELERIIIQEDAAWIPLFSRLRYYAAAEGVEGFRASWNGSVKNNYRSMSAPQS